MTSTCSDPVTDCACTEEFRTYTLTVVDVAGQPVPDVVITRTHVPTGLVLEPVSPGLPAEGTYVIADDGMLEIFSSEGDVVRVIGGGNDASFQADCVFVVPDPCRCHVVRIAGPDTVTIR